MDDTPGASSGVAAVSKKKSYSWRSEDRPDCFAFKNTKGVKKKPYRKAGKYGTAERRVLDALSGYLNILGTACPSVPTIACKANCSDRTVQRVLNKLCARGWLERVGRSGAKYRDTIMYVFPKISPQMSPKDSINKERSFFKDLDSSNKTSAGALLWEQRQTQGKAHKENQKEQKQTPLTPTGFVPTPNCAAPLPKPKKTWPAGTNWSMGTWPEAESFLSGKRDSQLVTVWKNANQKAGFGMPTVPGVQGKQLRQLTRGKNAFEYVELRDVFIPTITKRWYSFLRFWVYTMEKPTIAKQVKYENDFLGRRAPFPAEPHVGFLLKHRKIALNFVKWVRSIESNADIPAEEKEHILTATACQYDIAVGPLPKNILAPYNKGKVWNSPVWAGHPKEPAVELSGKVNAKGGWNRKTQATALAKLVKRGVSKDYASAVLKYVKTHAGHFGIKTKYQDGLDGSSKHHPELVVQFWESAKVVYEERTEYKSLGHFKYFTKSYDAKYGICN